MKPANTTSSILHLLQLGEMCKEAGKKSKPSPEYVAETEAIRKSSRTPAAKKPHKFQKAKWTHPNGHPRCILCGDEQPVGGMCSGRAPGPGVSPKTASPEIAAYITGPSGGGKSTVAKKLLSTGEFKVIHTDDYARDAGGVGQYKTNWKALLEDVKKAKKPVVVEGTVLRPSLARKAVLKLLVDPGKEETLRRRMARKRHHGKDSTPEEGKKLWSIYSKGVKPKAQALGFKKVKGVGDAKKAFSKTSAVKEGFQLLPHQAVAIKQLIDNDGTLVMAHGTGTGKTASSIVGFETLRSLGKATKALVVVPTPLRANYVTNGIQKFTNSTVQVIGSKAESPLGYGYLGDVQSDKDYTVIGYEMFRKDPVGFMRASGADTLILDEYHKARDPSSETWKATMAARQQARNFIGMTASIVSNDPSEIAPLIAIAKKGQFLTPGQFERLYKRPVGETEGLFGGERKVYALTNVRDLQQRVGSVLSYMDPEDLKAGDMPRRQVETVDVPMSPEQEQLYRFAMKRLPPETAAKIRQNLPVSQREAMHVFGMILQARQASNSVASLDRRFTLDQSAELTPKVKRLLDDAQGHLQSTPDGKVVLFSNLIKGGVDVLDAGLTARGIPHGVFVGKGREIADIKVDEASRTKAVEDFNAGKTKVIVLSGAGAEGLNLPDSTAFLALDGHFNPERILQAEARARRLGGQAARRPEDRVVQVRRYRSVLPEPGFFSRLFGGKEKEFATDEWIYSTAGRKFALNRMLRNAVRAVSLSTPKGEPPQIPVPYAKAAPSSPRVSRPAAGPKPPVGVAQPATGSVETTEPLKSKKLNKYLRRWKSQSNEWRYEYPRESPSLVTPSPTAPMTPTSPVAR